MDKYLNKIICGDCLQVMKGMPDKCVDLVLTDIPYNEVNRPSNGLRILDKKDADVLDADLNDVLSGIIKVVRGSVYIFCGTEQVSAIRRRLVADGFSTRLTIWEKTNPSPMNGEYLWLSSIEACVFGKLSRAPFNRHCESPVFRFPTEHNQVHPTQKPLSLFKYLVWSSSNEGDIVFDPFIGSGTTALACIKYNRQYIGIELNPEYCAIANERIRQATRQVRFPWEE